MTAPAASPWPGADPPGVKALLTSGLAQVGRCAAARPDCQVLACVRYGQLALCASCDQRRSTLGKGTPPARLPDPGALLRIAAAREAGERAASELRHAVAAARQAGHPWNADSALPAISRQAAPQRSAPGTLHSPGAPKARLSWPAE